MSARSRWPGRGPGERHLPGWFHPALLTLAGVFLLWNAWELARALSATLPAPPPLAVLAGVEDLWANLRGEMERQGRARGSSPTDAARRLQTLLAMADKGFLKFPSGPPEKTGKPSLAKALELMSAAAIAHRELQSARPEDAAGIEFEARTRLLMAVTEARAVLLSGQAAAADRARVEHETRIRNIWVNLAFGTLTCAALLYSLLSRRAPSRQTIDEGGSPTPVRSPKPRVADMVINLDDTMITRIPIRESEPATRAPAPEPSASAPLHEPGSPFADDARRLAGAAARSLYHDLTVINGYSDLLLDSIGDDDPARADLAAIRRAGERANVLAGQLRAFSDSKPERWETIDVNRWIEQIRPRIDALIPPGVALHYEAGPVAGSIHGDPDRLEQAVKSLVLNATNAMPSGGEIVIETGAARVSADEQWPAITVRDTGRGIEAATMEGLFEPRRRDLRQPGTGIGLPAVASILEEHGGHVEAESAPGAGSSFRLLIPPATAGRAATAAGKPS